MNRTSTTVATLALVLGGCVGHEPIRTRWAPGSTVRNDPVVPVITLSSTAAKSTAANLTDFAERAGAAYIGALAAKTKSADEFRGAVAAAVAPGKIGDSDSTRLPRTIVIGIGRDGFQDGQRFLSIDVEMIPIGFSFSDYTLATSRYETINLETVSLQNTTTTKLDLAPKFGDVIEAVDASVQKESKSGTSYSNQERIEVLTVDFRPDRFGIRQRSSANEDLTGTVLVSAAVRPSGDAKSQLADISRLGISSLMSIPPGNQVAYVTIAAKLKIIDDAERAISPDEASVITVVDRVWIPRPLYVCASVRYTERVPSGDTQRFYDEGRQVVTERTVTLPGKLHLLVPREEVSRSLWQVFDTHGAAIAIDTPAGKPQALSFTNELDASRFAAWLAATRATSIGGKRMWTLDPRSGLPELLVPARSRVASVMRLFGETMPEPIIDGPCTVPGMIPTSTTEVETAGAPSNPTVRSSRVPRRPGRSAWRIG